MASLSHEFRTRLTTIVAYSDMLVAGLPELVRDAAALVEPLATQKGRAFTIELKSAAHDL